MEAQNANFIGNGGGVTIYMVRLPRRGPMQRQTLGQT